MIISVVNTKGGVGKTVTAINLGAALAARGERVLLVDVDMQAGLTNHFGFEPEAGLSSADVLAGAAGLEECAAEVRENLFVVPATPDIERSERTLTGASGAEVRLRRAFKEFMRSGADFPFVLIDCPSGWGPVTRNAILASNAMLVPLNCEPAAITCAVSTIAEAKELAEYHDHEIELLGVLLTRFRGTNAARAVEAKSQKLWGAKIFDARIRQAERVNELAFRGETASDGKHGHVSQDYELLAGEVIARTGVSLK